jgi:hypothetical protein
MIPTSKRAESIERMRERLARERSPFILSRAELTALVSEAPSILFDGETAQDDLGWHDSSLLASMKRHPSNERRVHDWGPNVGADERRYIATSEVLSGLLIAQLPDDEPTTALDIAEDDLERAVRDYNERRPDVSSHLDGGYVSIELVMIVVAVVLVIIACAIPAVNNILVSTSWKGQSVALAMVVGVIVIFSRVGRIAKRVRHES